VRLEIDYSKAKTLTGYLHPDRIFAPATSNGGCPKKEIQYKQVNVRPIDDPMFVLALKTI